MKYDMDHPSGVPQLMSRIGRISKLNEDSFRVEVEIRPTSTKILFDIEVFEAEERHTLARASGETLEEAIYYLQERIGPGLEHWGYIE